MLTVLACGFAGFTLLWIIWSIARGPIYTARVMSAMQSASPPLDAAAFGRVCGPLRRAGLAPSEAAHSIFGMVGLTDDEAYDRAMTLEIQASGGVGAHARQWAVWKAKVALAVVISVIGLVLVFVA